MKNAKPTFLKALISGMLFFGFAFTSQQGNGPETINWDTHFQGEPDANSPFAASTATRWSYSYKSTIRNNRLNIDFKFLAGVDPSKSWVNRSRIANRRASIELLNHEQGHVYINYLLLKDGEIKIRDQKYTINNYKNLIQTTANKVSDYYYRLQERYDEETNHGANLAAQAKWDAFLLQEMEKY